MQASLASGLRLLVVVASVTVGVTARAQDPVQPAPADTTSTVSNEAAPSAATPSPAASANASATPGAPPPATPTAQQSAAAADARVSAGEVRVIGTTPEALQRIPGSGDMVTTEDIHRAQPFDVGEMLRRLPGVQARQEYGGGLRLDISIRGLEGGRSRQMLVLEDGIPVALNPYAEPDMYYSPPVERMRGIELVKGSGNILFGPQTIGGVVNFLTLMPDQAQRASVDFEGGTYGYGRGMATYNDYFGNARYVVQALYRQGDGFRDEAFRQVDVLAKMAVDTSARGEAILKIGFHDDIADSDDVGLTSQMYQATPRRGTLAPNDQLHLQRYDVSVTHNQKITDFTSLKTLVYAYQTDRIWRRQNYERTRTPGESYDYVVGDEGIPYGAIYFQNTDTVLDRSYDVAGVEPRFRHEFSTVGIGHTLDFGARVLAETAHYQQRTGQTPTSYAGALDSEEQHRTIGLAAYAEDRIAFRDYLLVTPGVRLEHAEYSRTTTREGDQDVDSPGSSAATGVIPGIGIVAGARSLNVFGGMHVGWAPPRLTDSITPTGTPSQVSAEQSITYEVGTRYRPAKWLRGELTFFQMNFDNQVVVNTGAGGGPTTTQETDGGNTRHYGAEVGDTIEMGKLLKLGAILDLGVRYTYSRAIFDGGPNAGNFLPYAPLDSVNSNIDFEHKLGVGGQVAYSYVGSQFTDLANTVRPDITGRIGEMPGYSTLDLTVHYRNKATGLTFRLTVKNALNDVYIVARRPEGLFTDGYRQVLAGVRWDFEKRQGNEHP